MKTTLISLLVAFLIPISAFLFGCRNSNELTYTGPPPRQQTMEQADSTTVVIRPHLPNKVQNVSFEVPGPDSCRVKIEVFNAGMKLVRSLKDSVYAAGKHNVTWIAKGNDSVFMDTGHYYYQFEICGKVSTRSLHYLPGY